MLQKSTTWSDNDTSISFSNMLLAFCLSTPSLGGFSSSHSLFVQQKRKHDEMVFLMSRNANKHVLLALSVDRTARDAMKAKFTGVST